MSKLNLATNECSCKTCQQMCRRPCWGTPEDAQRLIDAGYGHRLMRDFWGEREEGQQHDTYILCPALKGHESKVAPMFPRSPKGCTFWKDGLCELHDLGLKPIEGKLASCKPGAMSDNDEVDLHEEIYLTWKNDASQTFAKEWQDKHIGEIEEEDPIMAILDLIQGMHDCLEDKNGTEQSNLIR